jgi:mRNA interferase MazF
VIISNDKQNIYSPLVIVVPITSKIDRIYAFEVPIQLDKNSKVMTDQIAALDRKRIKEKIGSAPEKVIKEIVKALHYVLAFPCYPNLK